MCLLEEDGRGGVGAPSNFKMCLTRVCASVRETINS